MTRAELRQKALKLADYVLLQIGRHMEELSALRNGEEPWDRAIALWLWENVFTEEEKEGVRLVDGVIGYSVHSHVWYELSMPPEEAHELDFRFIVDPAVPDCYPSVLCISPRSPLKKMYVPIKVDRDGNPVIAKKEGE